MKNNKTLVQDIVISLIAAVILGAGVAFFQPGLYLQAWLPTSLLLWISLFLGLLAWRGFGGGKSLAALLLTAFLIRLVLGIFLHTALPAIGFDNEVQNAGFVYSDAYTRETQAFTLASGDESLFSAFSRSLHGDQYGGLLFLSASVYRFLSPDAARPLLITILGAFCMSIGLAFLYKVIDQRWGRTAALVAGWFYTLYPEGVLLGSSQMREPFLIGLFCIGFWAVSNWREKTAQKVLVFAASMAFACVLSLPFGGAISGMLILYTLVDWLSNQTVKRNLVIGWTVLCALALSMAAAGWMWLKPTLYYDAYLTEQSSGNIQALLEILGGAKWLIPFTSLSGITQPLLPAAVFDRSLPIWVTIAIVRSVGWYFAIPFILYAFFAAWKPETGKKNWVLILAALAVAAWICISTLRAGGDLWDNPRYRALMIPWLAWIVGWGWQRIRSGRGAWFYRWLAIEGLFLLGMFNWYLARYQYVETYISFFNTILLIVGLSVMIVISGVITGLLRSRRGKTGKDSIS